MELETVIISGLEYKVVLKGNKKFAYYKPANDWLGSTMPVWEIEQAIKNAKRKNSADAQVEEDEFLPPIVNDGKKFGRWPERPDILSALAGGAKTMKEIQKKTGRGPTAIKTAIADLGDKVVKTTVASNCTWVASGKVSAWRLAA